MSAGGPAGTGLLGDGAAAAVFTPSQTIGPFFAVAIPGPGEGHLVEPGAPGAIRLEGRVLDGAGAPVDDALVEIWQAGTDGRQPTGTEFTGFGRCRTDASGRYGFVTVRPGRVPAPGGGMQAPHIDVSVFARGLLARLVTRVYFPDEEVANADDAVLASLPEGWRATLVATAGDGHLRFDIHLQGDGETIFFAV